MSVQLSPHSCSCSQLCASSGSCVTSAPLSRAPLSSSLCCALKDLLRRHVLEGEQKRAPKSDIKIGLSRGPYRRIGTSCLLVHKHPSNDASNDSGLSGHLLQPIYLFTHSFTYLLIFVFSGSFVPLAGDTRANHYDLHYYVQMQPK